MTGWTAAPWDCPSPATNWDTQRDVPIFDALVAQLKAQYCVDPERVFVVGHATGAMLANAIACMRSDVMRGLGSFSGGPPVGSCTGRVAAWMTQGNASSMVNLGRAARSFWVAQNGCELDVTMPVTPIPCQAYAGCGACYPVQYCEYDGNLDLPSFAAQGVWSFFQSL